LIVMCPPQLLRPANIFLLALFGAAKKQMHLKAHLPEIHAIAGAEIHSQLRNAFAHWFDIAKESLFKAVNTDADPGSGLQVKAVQPFGERLPSGFVPADQNLSWSGFQARLRAAPTCDI